MTTEEKIIIISFLKSEFDPTGHDHMKNAVLSQLIRTVNEI